MAKEMAEKSQGGAEMSDKRISEKVLRDALFTEEYIKELPNCNCDRIPGLEEEVKRLKTKTHIAGNRECAKADNTFNFTNKKTTVTCLKCLAELMPMFGNAQSARRY